MFRPQISRLLLALVLLLVIGLTGVGLATAQTSATPQINAVYFMDHESPGLGSERARAYGVAIVDSSDGLMAEAASADAIVIDRSAFARVDRQWLAGQLEAGKLIIALNTPSAQLEQLPGYSNRSGPDNFRQDWGRRAFFSYVIQQQVGGVRYEAAGSDAIYSLDGFLNRLNSMVQAKYKVERSSQSAPPVSPSRP
jgi:hypothetical protein